jgi:hypothetical protein
MPLACGGGARGTTLGFTPPQSDGFSTSCEFFFQPRAIVPHKTLVALAVSCELWYGTVEGQIGQPTAVPCCARCAKRDGTRPWLRDDRTLSPAHSPRFVVVSGTRKKSSLTSRPAPRSPLHQRVRQNYTMPTTATAAVRRPYPHHTERRRRAEMPVGTLGRNRLPKILLVQQPQARHLQRTRGIEAQ